MDVKCCEEDDIYEVTPCELSNDNMAVVTIAHKLQHAELIKDRLSAQWTWTK